MPQGAGHRGGGARPMTLASSQQLFWSALQGEPLSAESVAQVFSGTAELPAAARVGIYANMVLYRQVDALREDFPCLAALCGGAAFFALGRAYLTAHPSVHPSLSRLGAVLPSYLRTAAAGAALGDAARPDLADLAELEWARCEVFDEADATPPGPGALAALGPERFAAARVRLVPAIRRLDLGFDVASVFRAVQGVPATEGAQAHDANGAHEPLADESIGHAPIARGVVPVSAPGRAAVVAWRQREQIFHAPIAFDEAEALLLASQGAPLGEVCGAFLSRPDPAGSAFAALRSWFADGWVASID
ncbi:MAG: DNA-binding domain-containing protein [Myxococcales bacterium]